MESDSNFDLATVKHFLDQVSIITNNIKIQTRLIKITFQSKQEVNNISK